METYLALVIEDSPDQALVFQKAVETAGYDVEVISDGKAARSRLAQDPIPVLIILDLHLPSYSGDKLLHLIHSDPRFGGTSIILATADAQMADQVRDQSDLVLLKPISFVQLSQLAHRVHPGS